MKIIAKIDSYLDRASSYGLVIAVLAMLFLSVLVIVLRWFNITFHWYDPFVRHLVFLSAFLGGVIATGRGNHIGIDILSRFLEAKNLHHVKDKLNFIIGVIASLSLIWLAHACYKFTLLEFEYGKPTFFGIHSGALVALMPLGFVLISMRFFLRSLLIFDKAKEIK